MRSIRCVAAVAMVVTAAVAPVRAQDDPAVEIYNQVLETCNELFRAAVPTNDPAAYQACLDQAAATRMLVDRYSGANARQLEQLKNNALKVAKETSAEADALMGDAFKDLDCNDLYQTLQDHDAYQLCLRHSPLFGTAAPTSGGGSVKDAKPRGKHRVKDPPHASRKDRVAPLKPGSVDLDEDLGAVLAGGQPAKNMCAECDVLREKLDIVRAKHRAIGNGLDLLQSARRELNTNAKIADGIGLAYVLLQGVKISIDIATLPCSVPLTWAQRAVMGGLAGLGSYVQGGNAGKVSMATVVSSVGGRVLGSVAFVDGVMSSYEFMQQYRAGRKGIHMLKGDMDETTRRFDTARAALEREQRLLESQLSRSACE